MKRWCAHPLRMGSFVPSSRALGRLMAHTARDALLEGEYVVELGVGTGRFTQELVACGISDQRIIGLELDPDLVAYLRTHFPQMRLIQGNACFLDGLIPQALHKKVGVVISGLPMLNFPLLVQEKIIQGALAVLKPGGIFLQFSYSPFASVSWQRFGLNKKRLGFVWNNFPPATVWQYSSARPEICQGDEPKSPENDMPEHLQDLCKKDAPHG